jgi:hypothetical protein
MLISVPLPVQTRMVKLFAAHYLQKSQQLLKIDFHDNLPKCLLQPQFLKTQLLMLARLHLTNEIGVVVHACSFRYTRGDK